MAAIKRTNSKVAKQFIKKTPVVLGLKFLKSNEPLSITPKPLLAKSLFKS